jgi:N,N-dimethylformamidase
METYLAGGGRLMYLGGNGFFSVVSFPPDSTHCIEMRRAVAWAWSEAGELYHSTTGEPGGNWNPRGRPSGRLIGVGSSTGEGFDYSMPYHRLEGSYDPRAAFIFAGIGKDEVIGNFGLKQGGAGGVEIDRAGYSMGTPPHALILARASGFSDQYQLTFEAESVAFREDWFRARERGGSQNPLVRSDLVYFEGPGGGGVFSVGSIAWCGSLSHNNYNNNVSRITKNVLDRFSSDVPIPQGTPPSPHSGGDMP